MYVYSASIVNEPVGRGRVSKDFKEVLTFATQCGAFVRISVGLVLRFVWSSEWGVERGFVTFGGIRRHNHAAGS